MVREIDAASVGTRASIGEKRTLLVQPALSNHPELSIEANANLATARLVTGLSIDGDGIPTLSLCERPMAPDPLILPGICG